MKARSFATMVLKAQRKTQCFTEMPKIDKHWLLRWKRDKGVVFRKPNARSKCSKPVLLRRLRAMWLNCIRVRRLAQQTLGRDLADSIYGIDEKPLHFNEAGSKNVRTLELSGAPCVQLKQNHAATRERCTIMTTVTSNLVVASMPSRPPIEIMFKAKGPRRIRPLVAPPDLNFSITWAVKGSYRTEHMLTFLDRWLDPWTADREQAQDYRILLLDVANSHLSDEVLERAWSSGYL
jgi:hypothetical protein